MHHTTYTEKRLKAGKVQYLRYVHVCTDEHHHHHHPMQFDNGNRKYQQAAKLSYLPTYLANRVRGKHTPLPYFLLKKK
jgi:hypothetical protein